MTLEERTKAAVKALSEAKDQEALYKVEAQCTRLLADLKAIYDQAPTACPEWQMAKQIHHARLNRAGELAEMAVGV